MQAEAMAGGATTSFRSILDKPLNQLTEDDISQLTREDCRKYLKEKGMRRPSWNKSQAIQQVISLKALLESTNDSGAGALRRILVSKAQPAKGTSTDVDVATQEDTGLRGRNGSFKEGIDDAAIVDPGATKRWSAAAIEQMTIFYCGKVNVYESVPPDKARAILHLAAGPNKYSVEDADQRNTFLSSPSPVWGLTEKCEFFPYTATRFHTEKTADHQNLYKEKGISTIDVEGQACRKVSLQRYLDKKRDRGKFKSKKPFGAPSSGLEMYLDNHPSEDMKEQTSGYNRTAYPALPRTSNQMQFGSFSFDFNPGLRKL